MLGTLAVGSTHRHAHAAAHEAEVLHPDHRLVSVDLALRHGEGIGVRVLGARLLEAVGVFLGVAELERILFHLRGGQVVEAGIEQQVQPRIGGEPPMMLAARTHIEIVAIFAREDHFLAARAPDPQRIVGGALRDEGQRIADASEPVHAISLG